MNKNILLAALSAALLAGAARAEEKPAPTAKESIMTFFKNLKNTLSQSAVQGERKKARGAGSVAAVRGAGQYSELADPNETSLKGDVRAKRTKQSVAEDGEFEKGVSLVLAGKTDEGIAALEAFKVKYPKSRNLASVDEAIAKAKALAAEKAVTEKPAESPKAEPAK